MSEDEIIKELSNIKKAILEKDHDTLIKSENKIKNVKIVPIKNKEVVEKIEKGIKKCIEKVGEKDEKNE